MRILTVSAQKPDSTGSGVYLAETARGFMKNGHEVCIVAGIAPVDEPCLPEGARFIPVRYETESLPFPVCGMSDQMPYKATRYRDMTPAMVEAFAREFSQVINGVVQEFEPDLVVCHHLYLLTAVVSELSLPCPVTAVCHSTDLRQMERHNLERERILTGVRRLDRIFALHAEQREEIIELYGVAPERVVVVGTGYNEHLFFPVLDQEQKKDCSGEGGEEASEGASEGAPLRVIYAGKIWRKKGVDCLLRSLKLLPFAPSELVVDLAGGYNSEDELATMKELAAQAPYEVNFLGKLPQEELADAYRRADIFVLPSFFEGLPLVLVEALACGCVAVTTDLPGIQPWLSQALPEAPVFYVEPPRIVNADEPVAAELPGFEERLAVALEEAAAMVAACEGTPTECRHLSWSALAAAMVQSV